MQVSPYHEMRRELVNLNRHVVGLMDELMSDWPEQSRHPSDKDAYSPLLNIYETAQKYMIDVELAGVKKEAVSLDLVSPTTLKLSGTRERTIFPPGLSGERKFHRTECKKGNFERQIRLPFSVKPGDVRAVFQDGVLEITLDKRPGEVGVRVSTVPAVPPIPIDQKKPPPTPVEPVSPRYYQPYRTQLPPPPRVPPVPTQFQMQQWRQQQQAPPHFGHPPQAPPSPPRHYTQQPPPHLTYQPPPHYQYQPVQLPEPPHVPPVPVHKAQPPAHAAPTPPALQTASPRERGGAPASPRGTTQKPPYIPSDVTRRVVIGEQRR